MTNRHWSSIMATADKPNRNGVIYTKGVLFDAMDDYITNGGMHYGFLSPDNHDTNGQLISHYLCDAWFEDNDLIGEIELLDTPRGHILDSILNCGDEAVSLGIRGNGAFTKLQGKVKSRPLFENDFGNYDEEYSKTVDHLTILSIDVHFLPPIPRTS